MTYTLGIPCFFQDGTGQCRYRPLVGQFNILCFFQDGTG